MTNSEKFRKEVSDEFLACAITYYCGVCPAKSVCDDEATKYMNCEDTCMYWLKQEAEE